MGDGDADRPAPDLAVADDEAGDEILIFAGWNAVLEADADYLVAGALRPVPGAMLGRERIAAILGGKVVAVVEGHAKRGRMRLDQHVRRGDPAFQVAPRAGMARILMVADVEPGPAVEGILAHPRDIIGHQIIA